jgi:hypothetical protein
MNLCSVSVGGTPTDRKKALLGYDFENGTNILSANNDLTGHGTNVAGIAGALTNNYGVGIAGVAGGDSSNIGCTLVNMRNGNGGFQALYNSLITGATNNPNGDPGYDLNVINLSIGAVNANQAEKQMLTDAVRWCFKNGCTVVAAAGDVAGHTYVSYPASLHQENMVINVAGSDPSGLGYNGLTSTIYTDVTAPCLGTQFAMTTIDTTVIDSFGNPVLLSNRYDYAHWKGTSFSAAFVS